MNKIIPFLFEIVFNNLKLGGGIVDEETITSSRILEVLTFNI